jgi:hypothetical protein
VIACQVDYEIDRAMQPLLERFDRFDGGDSFSNDATANDELTSIYFHSCILFSYSEAPVRVQAHGEGFRDRLKGLISGDFTVMEA